MSDKIFEIDRDHVVHDVFEGETVIINFETGRYYSLLGCAPFIWRLLQDSPTANEVTQSLVEHYGINEEQAVAGGKAFLDKITAEQLVLVKTVAMSNDSGSGVGNANGDIPAEEYVAPDIEVFNDLEELIQLDPVHEASPDKGWPARLPSDPESKD